MNEYTMSKARFSGPSIIGSKESSCFRYYLLKCDDTPEYVIGVEIINGSITDISLGHVFQFDSLNGNTYDVYEKISEDFYICSLAQDLYSSMVFIQIRMTFGRMELIELMYNSDKDEVFLNGVRCIPKE